MGDAAIVLAMNASLKAAFGPETQVRVCFCGVTADPEAFQTHYPELNFVRTLWHAQYDGAQGRGNFWARLVRKSVAFRFPLQARFHRAGLPSILLWPGERDLFREYLAADAILVSGGGFLNSTWTFPAMRAWRLAEYRTALLLEKPLIFYAQSFGPFTPSDPFLAQLRPILEQAASVLCRDAESAHVLREQAGVTTENLLETLDEAILLTPRSPSRPLAPPRQRPHRIGLCLHQWPWPGADDPQTRQREFEARVRAVCIALLERGDTELVFITTHQGIARVLHNDEAVVQRLRDSLPESLQPHTHIVSGFVHPCEFAHFMGECDLVLSSRMHGAILSLVGGAPALALGYEPKMLGFLRKIGLEDWTLSMWDSTEEEILAAIEKLQANPQETEQRRREAVTCGRALAQKNVEAVKAALAARKTLLDSR
jgi:colanic acid/amylovoran biosynthesis protein